MVTPGAGRPLRPPLATPLAQVGTKWNWSPRLSQKSTFPVLQLRKIIFQKIFLQTYIICCVNETTTSWVQEQ